MSALDFPGSTAEPIAAGVFTPVPWDSTFACGVDEVGRGPLAGPVVTAAVILAMPIEGLKDSKRLSAKQREALAEEIRDQAFAWSLGRAEVYEIDEHNILRATHLAMRRAIEDLGFLPSVAYVDGNMTPRCAVPAIAVVKGDDRIPSISAASIIAKVARDEEMRLMSELYPQYGFDRHKGYATRVHLKALDVHGACPIHRTSFAPVRDAGRVEAIEAISA